MLEVCHALQARRAEFDVETACGRPLVWDPLDGRKACRIFGLADGNVQKEAERADNVDFFIDVARAVFRQVIAAVDGSLL